MTAIPVSFETFLQNHLFHNEIYAKLDGPVKSLSPPCCIQISYALNNSGSPIVKENYDSPEMGRKVRYVSDNKSNLYVIDVFDLKGYLDQRYGIGENYKGTKDEMIANIKDRTGIIRFGKAHVDVWQGDRYHQEATNLPDAWAKVSRSDSSHGVVSSLGAWDAPSVKNFGIYFWEVGFASLLGNIGQAVKSSVGF